MRIALFFAAALSLAACATQTGPDATGRFDSFDAVVTSDFRAYDQVHIAKPVASEEVQARTTRRRLGPTTRERVLGQQDIDRALGRLDRELRQAIGAEAALVDAPGPGILTISSVLTDLDANRPTQAELVANPSLSLNSVAAGDAAVMFELSEDGRVLATIEDSDNIVNLDQQPIVGIWFTADRFFQRTANRLAALLAG